MQGVGGAPLPPPSLDLYLPTEPKIRATVGGLSTDTSNAEDETKRARRLSDPQRDSSTREQATNSSEGVTAQEAKNEEMDELASNGQSDCVSPALIVSRAHGTHRRILSAVEEDYNLIGGNPLPISGAAPALAAAPTHDVASALSFAPAAALAFHSPFAQLLEATPFVMSAYSQEKSVVQKHVGRILDREHFRQGTTPKPGTHEFRGYKESSRAFATLCAMQLAVNQQQRLLVLAPAKITKSEESSTMEQKPPTPTRPPAATLFASVSPSVAAFNYSSLGRVLAGQQAMQQQQASYDIDTTRGSPPHAALRMNGKLKSTKTQDYVLADETAVSASIKKDLPVSTVTDAQPLRNVRLPFSGSRRSTLASPHLKMTIPGASDYEILSRYL